jgi:hypothetical protein
MSHCYTKNPIKKERVLWKKRHGLHEKYLDKINQ